MNKPKIDERIAAAFSANQKSEVVAALIQDVSSGLNLRAVSNPKCNRAA